jgi:hypothetical protein
MLQVGDRVALNKEDQCVNWIRRAEVIQTPRGEGDLWGFRNLETGQEVYTSERFTAYKLPASLAPPDDGA